MFKRLAALALTFAAMASAQLQLSSHTINVTPTAAGTPGGATAGYVSFWNKQNTYHINLSAPSSGLSGNVSLSLPVPTGTAGCWLDNGAGVTTIGSCATGGSSGTVTSIATSSPITGGTITTSGTIGCATCLLTLSMPSGLNSSSSGSVATVGWNPPISISGSSSSPILSLSNSGSGLALSTSGGLTSSSGTVTITTNGGGYNAVYSNTGLNLIMPLTLQSPVTATGGATFSGTHIQNLGASDQPSFNKILEPTAYQFGSGGAVQLITSGTSALMEGITGVGVPVLTVEQLGSGSALLVAGDSTFNGNASINGTATLNGSVNGTHGQNIGTGDWPSFTYSLGGVSVIPSNYGSGIAIPMSHTFANSGSVPGSYSNGIPVYDSSGTFKGTIPLF